MRSDIIKIIAAMLFLTICISAFAACQLSLPEEDSSASSSSEQRESGKSSESYSKRTTAKKTSAQNSQDKEQQEEEKEPTAGLLYLPRGNDAYAVISLGEATETDIVIASSYEGKPVTAIDTGAFALSNIKSVYIPRSISFIGSGAFDECAELESLHIPASVIKIEGQIMRSCSKLTSITVDAKNPNYSASGNCLIERSTKTLIEGCKASIIPADGSVTVIGEYAFCRADSLTEIDIPSPVKSIEPYAFSGCNALEAVTVSSSVSNIGEYAFNGCDRVTETVDGVSYVDTWMVGYDISKADSFYPKLRDGTLGIADKAIPKNAWISNIELPTSFAHIGKNTFANTADDFLLIGYKGTKAKWNAIEKESGWYAHQVQVSVNCTDGSLEYSNYN